VTTRAPSPKRRGGAPVERGPSPSTGGGAALSIASITCWSTAWASANASSDSRNERIAASALSTGFGTSLTTASIAEKAPTSPIELVSTSLRQVWPRVAVEVADERAGTGLPLVAGVRRSPLFPFARCDSSSSRKSSIAIAKARLGGDASLHARLSHKPKPGR
jgi:hypothetical protein